MEKFEPADFETEIKNQEVLTPYCLFSTQQAALQADPMKDILVFPENDWEISVRRVILS
jgi:hypothetical protein